MNNLKEYKNKSLRHSSENRKLIQIIRTSRSKPSNNSNVKIWIFAKKMLFSFRYWGAKKLFYWPKTIPTSKSTWGNKGTWVGEFFLSLLQCWYDDFLTPVRSQRHFNVHTTSSQRYRRFIDVIQRCVRTG